VGEPALSVIVAAVNPRRTMSRWLAAITPQTVDRDVEVIIVAREADAAAIQPGPAAPFARVLAVPGEPLVPVLWGTAMPAARAPVLAVTITACEPAPDWVESILVAHRATHAGIGGTIDIAANPGLVDRAVHLVRYTPYLPPQTAGPVPEIAGDNGSYKRAALEQWLPATARDGFWESEFHRHLHARGESLCLDPAIRVTHAGSYSAAEFSRQRFRHGRLFGRARGHGRPRAARWLRTLTAPVIPPAMLLRALRSVAARGRLDARTLAAVPLALWFLICWAAGEAAGLADR
jgi:hypothetical protein